MIKISLLFIIFSFELLSANILYFEPESKISYTGYHPAHNWTGISTSFRGGIICSENSFRDCSIKIVAPITTFDSGNTSRDSNMLLYTKSKDYPNAIYESDKFDIVDFDKKTLDFKGTLDFNGLKNIIKTSIEISKFNENIHGHCDFKILLDDYDVDRPQLLFIPISNEIDIKAHLIIKNIFEKND